MYDFVLRLQDPSCWRWWTKSNVGWRELLLPYGYYILEWNCENNKVLPASCTVPWYKMKHAFFQVRNSKDYVYGTCVHKVLGIWKGYYRVQKNH